ncbi:MAG: helix-turn-helix transcriptional regulator [Lachnospiraceae bacterium]|nr:helix-turn-helix transcriptional regulator [Lachnospiraceae bacterium]
MNPVLFSETIPGLFVEEVLRRERFSMQGGHFHDSIELYFLLDGTRYYFVEQETFLLQSRTAILIRPGLIHQTSMPGDVPEHHRLLLQYEPDPFDRILKDLGYEGFEAFAAQYGTAVSFTEADWEEVLRLLSQLKSVLLQPARSPHRNAQARILALSMLVKFAQQADETGRSGWKMRQTGLPAGEKDGIYDRVDAIAQYLQQNSASAIRLDALADRFYLSKAYMTRIFRRVTGFSIIDYLTYIRIRRAQDLLVHTDTDITAISEMTGFGNVTYFERVFRQKTTLTPLQYRKRYQKT